MKELNRKLAIRGFLVITALTMTVGCLQNGASSSPTENASASLSQDLVTNKVGSVNLKLTDTPDGQFDNIIVKVKELEVILAKGDKAAKVVLSQNIGSIDLMDFQNGKLMNLSSLNVPDGVYIREIRLRLDDNGNYVVRKDGSICNLKTPSAQKSGLKLKLPDTMQVETGFIYNVVVNFNASKQIVQQGHGGCLLKPVLKLQSATKAIQDQPESEEPIEDDDSSSGSPTTGTETDNTGNDSGSDSDSEYQEGIDYIVDGDKVIIPQQDGTFIVVEGVDLAVISIEEILNYFK